MTDNLDGPCNIEDFPLGEDEDLLALSDPPHCAAYPSVFDLLHLGDRGMK